MIKPAKPNQQSQPRRETGGGQSPQPTYDLEAEVIAGLEDLASAELGRICSAVTTIRPGVLRCRFSGRLGDLLKLRLVVAVYVLRFFDVPRPKALLGHQHFTVLLDTIRAIQSLDKSRFKTLRLSAAGEDSVVLTRLRDELAAKAGLKPTTEEGDMLLRLRRAGSGWELLARISPRPLSARAWRVCNLPGALNATVAAAMIALTDPQPGDFFLNLAAGSGTFLIERLAAGPARLVVGCEIAGDALACAYQNLAAAQVGKRISLAQANVKALPLPDKVADALVADLPFGNLVGSHSDNAVLYPALLAEAARVAKPGARMALISHEIRLMERLVAENTAWTLQSSRRITLPFKAGGVNPAIFVLNRT